MAYRYFTTYLEQEGSSPRERCNWVERKSLIFLSWPFHYFLATHLVTHTRKLGCPPLLFLSYSTSNSCILQIRVCKLVGHIWPQNVLCLALRCIKLKKKWDILHENLNVWFPSTKKNENRNLGSISPRGSTRVAVAPFRNFFLWFFPLIAPSFTLSPSLFYVTCCRCLNLYLLLHPTS